MTLDQQSCAPPQRDGGVGPPRVVLTVAPRTQMARAPRSRHAEPIVREDEDAKVRYRIERATW